jgi:choline dehydrogenase
VRGHRADYDGWAQRCPGWSYDEVLPYFQRAERRVGSNAGGVYGTSGAQFISELRDPNPTTSAFLAACAELGMRRLGELNEPDNTRICTDAGDPAPRLAAQCRGRVSTAR